MRSKLIVANRFGLVSAADTGEPTTSTSTTTETAPPSDGEQVEQLTRQLSASKKARLRERRAFRRRLRVVILGP